MLRLKTKEDEKEEIFVPNLTFLDIMGDHIVKLVIKYCVMTREYRKIDQNQL